MNKLFLLRIALVLGFLAIVATLWHFSRPNQPALTEICPDGTSYYMLPRTFPGKSLFIGYSGDYFHQDFVGKAIQSIIDQKLGIDVNILIPKSQVKESFQDLKKFRKEPFKSFVRFSVAPTDEALWVQDYIDHAFHLKKKEDFLVELPYWDREGEDMSKSVSFFKNWDMLEAPAQRFYTEEHTEADYGGNVEALPYDTILIGDTMSSLLKDHLQTLLPHQKFLEVPIQWVENNHVDEIYTLLPTETSPCGFAIGYASPRMAMEIMENDEQDLPLWSDEFVRDEGNRDYPYEQCTSTKSFFQCEGLIQANFAYAREIETANEIIRDHFASRCSSLELIPLPQLFMPLAPAVEYGTRADEARAFNPSIVNSLLIGKHILYSKQAYKGFADATEAAFLRLGLVPKALESGMLQASGGGFHCASMMAHQCVSLPDKE